MRCRGRIGVFRLRRFAQPLVDEARRQLHVRRCPDPPSWRARWSRASAPACRASCTRWPAARWSRPICCGEAFSKPSCCARSRPARCHNKVTQRSRSALNLIEPPLAVRDARPAGAQTHQGAIGHLARQLSAGRIDVVAARAADGGDDAVLRSGCRGNAGSSRPASAGSACRETR